MEGKRAPDYGIDAPKAVRNLLIVAALGVISFITLRLGLWSRQDLIAVIAWPLMWAGLGSGVMGSWMIYDGKIGKAREREQYLDQIAWRGDERVLDVGCGLGLFLIGAAKRLSTGRAVGIDKWQLEDLSGNHAAGTLENARIEGVAGKVDVQTGDARRLPYDDASFDVVLSSSALHNIYNSGERQTAVREIARVLRSGGRVQIVDVRHLRHYAAILRSAGVDARCVQGFVAFLVTVITFGSIQCGYVIGEKASGTATGGGAPRRLGGLFSLVACFAAQEDAKPAAPSPVPAPTVAPRSGPESVRKRSILFYLIDTCRADHWSANGYSQPTTPFLEKLAARGVRFENCFSQAPWTKPSVATILTSCYPTVTGMHQLFGQLDNSFVTLPEALRDAGWYTAGFSANPLMGRMSNYNQGFRRFVDATTVIPSLDMNHSTGGSAKALNRHVLPWLEQNSEWPFFLYVHSVDPHENYEPAPEYLKLFADPAYEAQYRKDWQALIDVKPRQVANVCTKEDFEKSGVTVGPFIEYGKQLYDADIRANDDEIARLVDALDRKGRLEDMIVIVTADHGEEFFEHGGTSHAFMLWNELIHVPLLIVAPGLLPEGLVVKEPVRSIDLYPTLLDLLGVTPPDGLQGRSFAPQCRGEPGDGRIIFSENHETPGSETILPNQGITLSMIRGPWKLILNLKSPALRPRPRVELYRIDRDFAERDDLAEAQPDLCADLEKTLLSWWAANRARHEGVSVRNPTRDELEEADPDTLERLRKLGYVK